MLDVLVKTMACRGVAVILGMLSALEPAWANNFGAIAYSQSSRAYGWSYDHASRRKAEQYALRQCARHATDCTVVLYFYENCGALAAAGDGAVYTAWAATRLAAEQDALRDCRKTNSSCSLLVWACNSTGDSGSQANPNACFADIGIRCAAQCGGYQQPCYGSCTGGASWQCNQ